MKKEKIGGRVRCGEGTGAGGGGEGEGEGGQAGGAAARAGRAKRGVRGRERARGYKGGASLAAAPRRAVVRCGARHLQNIQRSELGALVGDGDDRVVGSPPSCLLSSFPIPLSLLLFPTPSSP